jgi:hypothetical protein
MAQVDLEAGNATAFSSGNDFQAAKSNGLQGITLPYPMGSTPLPSVRSQSLVAPSIDSTPGPPPYPVDAPIPMPAGIPMPIIIQPATNERPFDLASIPEEPPPFVPAAMLELTEPSKRNSVGESANIQSIRP